MRHSLLPAAGVAVAALVAAGAFSAGATASSGPQVSTSHQGSATAAQVHPFKKGNCYSNANARNDEGNAVLSQNFESQYAQYDAQAADNFNTKNTCNTTGVYVPGQYFNGAGPAYSETVTFYTDASGMPGSVINTQTVVGQDNGTGTFTIPLSTVALPPGPKWVSVVANMDFAAGGEWGWELTSNVKQGSEGMWQNPGGGFGVCPTWGTVTDCIGNSGDFMVTIGK